MGCSSSARMRQELLQAGPAELVWAHSAFPTFPPSHRNSTGSPSVLTFPIHALVLSEALASPLAELMDVTSTE